MIEEYKKNGYVIFDDLLPEEEYKKILDICKNSSYNKISQKRSDRYALWETPDDKFFPDSDEVYENQFWGTDEVVQTDEVKQMFDKYIKPKVLANKNRLVLMNHSLRMGHWVTPTNTWAKENRYTIVGFCIDKDKDLPETWTKRKDQRIDK